MVRREQESEQPHIIIIPTGSVQIMPIKGIEVNIGLLEQAILTMHALPRTLRSLIHNPKPNGQEYEDQKDSLMALPHSGFLPQTSPIIGEGLAVAKEYLNPATNLNATLEQQEAAAMLADTILYQTSLPMEKKRAFRRNRTAAKRGLQGFLGAFPREDITSEQAALIRDVAQLSRAALVRRDNPQPVVYSETSALELMGRYNTRVQEEVDSFTLQYWIKAGDPQLVQEYRDGTERLRDTITYSSIMQELLIQGRLPDVSDNLAALMIARVWEPRFNQPADADRADYTSAARFFLDNPQIHTPFWEFVLKSQPGIVNDDGRYQAKNENLTKVATFGGMIEWFLMQKPSLLDPFLASLGSVTDKSNLSILVRKVMGMAALMKTRLPEYPTSATIGTSIAEAFDRARIDASITEEQITILQDKSPGVIYLTMDQEARARSPRPSQNQADFDKEQAKQPGVIVYYSKAMHTKDQVVTTKPSLEVTGTLIEVPGWREAVLPEPEQVDGIVEWMGRRIRTTPETSFDLLADYKELTQVVGREENANALFPPLLPEKHPLRELLLAGVLAVENSGGEIRVIVDSKRADLKTGASKVLLTGRLNEHAELCLDGAGEEASLEPFPMILNAAVVYGEIKILKEELNKDEIREARAMTKSWNTQARKAGYPQVEYNADSKIVEGTEGVVLPIEVERANRRRATRLTLIK